MHSHMSARRPGGTSSDDTLASREPKRLKLTTNRTQQAPPVIDLTSEPSGTPLAMKPGASGNHAEAHAARLHVPGNPMLAGHRKRRFSEVALLESADSLAQDPCWASLSGTVIPPSPPSAAAAHRQQGLQLPSPPGLCQLHHNRSTDVSDVVVVSSGPQLGAVAAAATAAAAADQQLQQQQPCIHGNPPLWHQRHHSRHTPLGAAAAAAAAPAAPVAVPTGRRRLTLRASRHPQVGSSSRHAEAGGRRAAAAAVQQDPAQLDDAAIAAQIQEEEDARLAQQLLEAERQQLQEARMDWLQALEEDQMQQQQQQRGHHSAARGRSGSARAHMAAALAAAAVAAAEPPAAGSGRPTSGRRSVRSGRRGGGHGAPRFGAFEDAEGELSGPRRGWGMAMAEMLLHRLAGQRGGGGSGWRGASTAGLPGYLQEALTGVSGGLPPSLLFSDRDFTADDYEALCQLDESVESRKGASKSTIESLPLQTVPAGGLKAENGERLSCAVCLEELSEGAQLRALPCLHRFHASCIDRWLQQKAACPVCNRVVGGSV